MKSNIFKSNEFKQTEIFSTYTDTVNAIITKLIDALDSENVGYVIKIRADNSIVFALKDKPSTNIATIYIYREHIRLRIINEQNFDRNICKDDLDDIYVGEYGIVDEILNKYHQLKRNRKQYSIYVYSDVIEKLETISKKENKNVNQLIEEALDSLAMDTFINSNHKREFLIFMDSAGITSTVGETSRKTLILVATFYLLSAYQNYYFSQYKIKFTYNLENKSLSGPSDIIEHSEFSHVNAETAFLATEFLRSTVDNINLLPDLLNDMSNSKEINHIVNIAFKIISRELDFIDGELKTLIHTVDVSTLEDISLL